MRSLVLSSLLLLAPVSAGAASVQLSWTDNSATESGFIVERRQGSTGAFTELARATANVATYTDTTATAASTWCYQVKAFRNEVVSAPSNMACLTVEAPIEAPGDLNVTVTVTVTK